MTTFADLPLHVSRGGTTPMAAQLAAQIRDAVSAGVLDVGERLPSSRQLARSLGISRTVVMTSYMQLFAEGWLEGRHGSGTYVADIVPPASVSPGSVASAPAAAPTQSARAGAGMVVGVTPTSEEWMRCHTDGENRAGRRVGSGDQWGESGPGDAGAPWGDDRRDAGGPWGDDRRGAGGPWGAGGESRRGAGGPWSTGGGPGWIELRPGVPWAAGIDLAMWRRAFRQAGSAPPSPWPEFAGLPELRHEVAGYLRRARALVAAPEQVLITRGVASGLVLLAAAVVRPGDRVGLEEPGYHAARAVLTRAGAEVVPCRADAHGIVPEELPRDLRLVYTTPAHQYPLGGRLPVGRRRALIAWARETGALIVEDDYDSEFRYDVAPLPSLYGMAPEVVVYLGTVSKMLTPALGAGWLVGPAALVGTLAVLRRELGDRPPEPVQHATLAMLRGGDLERHVRKMRLEYARRRAAVVEALRDTSGRLLGDTAGLHVVLELPDSGTAERVRAAAARQRVIVHDLGQYYAGQPGVHGLAIGYGSASLPEVRRAVTVLRGLLLADRGGQRRRDRDLRFALLNQRNRVRPGEPADIDQTRAEAFALRHLRGAEVPAASPQRPGPQGGSRRGQRGRGTRRPLAGHIPGIQPADDRGEAGHRAAGEWFIGTGEHPDLRADPALRVHPRDLIPDGRPSPAQPLRRAERAAGPQDRDELRDVAGRRVPDQVRWPALGGQPFRRRLDRYGAGAGTKSQPDGSWRTASQGSPVGLRPDAFHAWHPCVCHRLPLLSV